MFVILKLYFQGYSTDLGDLFNNMSVRRAPVAFICITSQRSSTCYEGCVTTLLLYHAVKHFCILS